MIAKILEGYRPSRRKYEIAKKPAIPTELNELPRGMTIPSGEADS